MQWLLFCLLLSGLGLAYAAPLQQFSGYPYSPEILKFLDALERETVMDEANVNSLHETAESEVIPAVLLPLIPIGIKYGYKILNFVVQCAVCGECTAREENYMPIAFSGDPDADRFGQQYTRIVPILEAMENMDAAEQKLQEVSLNLMKDNRIAKAELAGWISKAIDKLKRTGKFIKGAAKKILCEDKQEKKDKKDKKGNKGGSN